MEVGQPLEHGHLVDHEVDMVDVVGVGQADPDV